MTATAPRISEMTTRTKLLAIVGLAAALLYLAAGRMDDVYWLRMVAKPIPVLMLALWVSGLHIKGRYQLAIMVGLLLSALGDILLEYSEATFLLGLAAFLLGHVAYIIAFLQDTRKLHPFYGAAAYAYGFFAAVFLMTTGDLSGMIGPVYLYSLHPDYYHHAVAGGRPARCANLTPVFCVGRPGRRALLRGQRQHPGLSAVRDPHSAGRRSGDGDVLAGAGGYRAVCVAEGEVVREVPEYHSG